MKIQLDNDSNHPLKLVFVISLALQKAPKRIKLISYENNKKNQSHSSIECVASERRLHDNRLFIEVTRENSGIKNKSKSGKTTGKIRV